MTKITFQLKCRTDLAIPDWALYVQFDNAIPFVIDIWSNKPTKTTLDNTKRMIIETMKYYHEVVLPKFNVEIIDKKEIQDGH